MEDDSSAVAEFFTPADNFRQEQGTAILVERYIFVTKLVFLEMLILGCKPRDENESVAFYLTNRKVCTTFPAIKGHQLFS